MAVGERPWCDLVIYTTQGLSVQIHLIVIIGKILCYPSLSFYDNLYQKVSPIHTLGLPLRNGSGRMRKSQRSTGWSTWRGASDMWPAEGLGAR